MPSLYVLWAIGSVGGVVDYCLEFFESDQGSVGGRHYVVAVQALSCVVFVLFFSSRRGHTRSSTVAWARRCVEETAIKNQEGSVSMEVEPPVGIIADTQIISQAPFRLLAAGCGDIISNYTAILDWKLAHRLLNEDFSDSSAALSLITAETMIKSAGDIKEGLIERAAIVVKALISSGMAISIAGNSLSLIHISEPTRPY